MTWVLNVLLLALAVAVFVGWLRNRRAEDYRDIRSSEISDDFAAQEELLRDALTEQLRSTNASAESHPGTPREPGASRSP